MGTEHDQAAHPRFYKGLDLDLGRGVRDEGCRSS